MDYPLKLGTAEIALYRIKSQIQRLNIKTQVEAKKQLSILTQTGSAILAILQSISQSISIGLSVTNSYENFAIDIEKTMDHTIV